MAMPEVREPLRKRASGLHEGYVRVRPMPILATVEHKPFGADDSAWKKRGEGRALVLFVERVHHMCLIVRTLSSVEAELRTSSASPARRGHRRSQSMQIGNVRRLRGHRRSGSTGGSLADLAKPGEQDILQSSITANVKFLCADATIAWKDDTTDTELRLTFKTLAACQETWSSIQMAQELARIIEDEEGRGLWLSSFGCKTSVRFLKVFHELQKRLDATLGDDEARLHLTLVDPKAGDNHVTATSFANFLKWYGPLDMAIDKWRNTISLSYFHQETSRYMAEDRLEGAPVGTFLARYSMPPFFAISYVDEPEESGGESGGEETGVVVHMRVENAGLAGFMLTTAENEILTGDSLKDIVERHSYMLFAPIDKMPFSPPPKANRRKRADSHRTPEFSLSGSDWYPFLMGIAVGDNDEHKLKVTKELIEMLASNDAHKITFIANRGVELLTALVESGDLEVERLVSGVLTKLAAMGMPLLRQCAFHEDSHVQQCVAYTLANLVHENPLIQQSLVENGVMELLNELASSENTYVQANVAWIFAILAQHECNKKPIVLSGLQSLYMLAKMTDDAVKTYASESLSRLGLAGERDDMESTIDEIRSVLRPSKGVWEIDFEQVTQVRQIGTGGYGDVFLGKWLGIAVAVKRIKDKYLHNLESFTKEVETMAKLRHPNVVLFLGACISPPSIVTEYMDRGSLWDIIHNRRTYPTLKSGLLVQMAHDSALGMAYLLEMGFLHRDLKSLNLLVNEQFRIKVADFGLTRLIEKKKDGAKESGAGTYAWRAPEVFLKQPYSPPADVYSYGIVIWELLTRKQPFRELDYAGIKVTVVKGGRPPLPKISEEDEMLVALRDLMIECWDQDPARRPSFDEIVRRLQPLKDRVVHSA